MGQILDIMAIELNSVFFPRLNEIHKINNLISVSFYIFYLVNTSCVMTDYNEHNILLILLPMYLLLSNMKKMHGI